MKKTTCYYLSLAAVVAGGLVSCQDENLGFSENEIHEAAVKRQYAKNFEDRYGKIDPEHTWGFGEIGAFNNNEAKTRGEDSSGAGTVWVNRNQWTETDNNGYKSDALASTVKIPGWPNFDGYYYTVTASSAYNQITSSQPTNMSYDQAAGDLTDYEIQYVSRWFREHKEPESIQLHLTDFFVQNVSGDADRVISDGKCNGAPLSTICGQSSAEAFGMEHLVFKTMDSNATIDDTWTHMNNYNNGNTNDFWYSGNYDLVLDSDKQGSDSGINGSYVNTFTHNREIKYVTSSGTEDFAYLSSFGTGSNYYKKWVLVRLTWDEKGADGQVHKREGYYLAFDFQTSYNGIKYDGDGFYSNWIIKISPAYGNENSRKNVRVMCEDLGNTLDFDFNDVVFDVRYEGWSDPYTAIVTLQAAGGTMKINVGNQDAKYEAHALLENKVTQPVNVDKGASHAVAIYRVGGLHSTNPNDITIWVNQGTESDTMDKIVTLDKAKNATPQKFAVPTSVRWTKENKQIEDAYELFGEWVKKKADFADQVDQWGNVTPANKTNWYDPDRNGAWPNHNGKKWRDSLHEDLLH